MVWDSHTIRFSQAIWFSNCTWSEVLSDHFSHDAPVLRSLLKPVCLPFFKGLNIDWDETGHFRCAILSQLGKLSSSFPFKTQTKLGLVGTNFTREDDYNFLSSQKMK